MIFMYRRQNLIFTSASGFLTVNNSRTTKKRSKIEKLVEFQMRMIDWLGPKPVPDPGGWRKGGGVIKLSFPELTLLFCHLLFTIVTSAASGPSGLSCLMYFLYYRWTREYSMYSRGPGFLAVV